MDQLLSNIKDYWNSRPCNIGHSGNTIGSKKWSDEITDRRYFVESHILKFADFSRWNGKKVLEIGCGIGTDTISFAKAGAIVTAVDLSEESIKLAKMRAEIEDCNIKFFQANCEELSKIVPVEKYDLIYSFGVIHHTPNPENALKQLYNYMGDETELRIMVYNKCSYKVLWILFKYGFGRFWNIDKLIAQYSEAQEGSPVTYTYSKSSIKKLLSSLNFNIESIKIEHIFPYRIPEYKKYQYIIAFPFNIIPSFIFKKLKKYIGWHLCVIAKKR